MTVGELIDFLGSNPYYTVFYCISIPLAAALANLMSKDEAELNPWCSFYAMLIYMSVIPGVFAILLNLYHFLFENTSIYDVNIMTQILPIISMVLSLYLIKQNIGFDEIPGFDKLTGFAGMMAGLMIIFFILDKARIVAFTYVPFLWIILILIILYLVIRYGTKFLFRR